MYEKTVTENALTDCLAEENYREATQMLIQEIKMNLARQPENSMIKDIYTSVMGVANRDSLAAKSVYDFVASMREVLLFNC